MTIIPEGWVLAPVAPTMEMLRALNGGAPMTYDEAYGKMSGRYAAMLASAPPAPGGFSSSQSTGEGRIALDADMKTEAWLNQPYPYMSNTELVDARTYWARRVEESSGWASAHFAAKQLEAIVAEAQRRGIDMPNPYPIVVSPSAKQTAGDSSRDEPLTPSPSLADKVLIQKARLMARDYRACDMPLTADMLTSLANALEARAARALSGEPGE